MAAIAVGDQMKVVQSVKGTVVEADRDGWFCIKSDDDGQTYWYNPDDVEVVSHILAFQVGQVLTTVEELEALPVGAKVIVQGGFYDSVQERVEDGWRIVGQPLSPWSSSDLRPQSLDVTLVHLP